MTLNGRNRSCAKRLLRKQGGIRYCEGKIGERLKSRVTTIYTDHEKLDRFIFLQAATIGLATK